MCSPAVGMTPAMMVKAGLGHSQSAIYRQLTEEQRVQLEEMAAQRMERRDERRKQRDGRG